MWEVRDRSGFASQGYFVRDRHGAEHWVVALRATFDIRADGLVSPAEVQTPVQLAPVYEGDAAGALAIDSDFCPFRRGVDVSLSGTACLPDAAPARVFDVTFAVGAFAKRLRCFAPRLLTRSVFSSAIDEGAAVQGVALRWQSALGGEARDEPPRVRPGQPEGTTLHPDNPVGTGWVRDWSLLPRGLPLPLPQIEDPLKPVEYGRPLPPPAGFGPVAPHWSQRRRYAGTYDSVWESTRHPLLPTDFDDSFHNAVPTGQTLDIRGGEAIRITNGHPGGPIAFRLPQLIIEGRTRIGYEGRTTRFRPISVAVDCSRRQVAMVWNMATPCGGRDMDIDYTNVTVVQASGVAR